VSRCGCGSDRLAFVGRGSLVLGDEGEFEDAPKTAPAPVPAALFGMAAPSFGTFSLVVGREKRLFLCEGVLITNGLEKRPFGRVARTSGFSGMVIQVA